VAVAAGEAAGLNSSGLSTGSSVVPSVVLPSFHVYPGTPTHLASIKGKPPPAAGFYVANEIRMETLHKNALVLAQPDPEQYPGECCIACKRFYWQPNKTYFMQLSIVILVCYPYFSVCHFFFVFISFFPLCIHFPSFSVSSFYMFCCFLPLLLLSLL